MNRSLRSSLLVFTLSGAGFALAAGGCRKAPEPQPAASSAVPVPAPVPVANGPRLPEDPAAGKASEEQWREHLAEEERERQMAFDVQRIEEHRAVAALFDAARSRYDGATTPSAVGRARVEVARGVVDIQRRVAGIDRWRNSSHLLNDYDALTAMLSGEYAEARLAALAGNPRPLEDARSRFDRHRKAIVEWLEEAEREEGHERERGEGNEHNHEERHARK